MFVVDVDPQAAGQIKGSLAAEGLGIETIEADVARSDQLEIALVRIGEAVPGIDILVTVAGGSAPGLVESIDMAILGPPLCAEYAFDGSLLPMGGAPDAEARRRQHCHHGLDIRPSRRPWMERL